MTDEQPKKPPQYRVPRGLYFLTLASWLWVFVVFFLSQPYTQAVSTTITTRIPIARPRPGARAGDHPMIGLAAFLAWTRRKVADHRSLRAARRRSRTERPPSCR